MDSLLPDPYVTLGATEHDGAATIKTKYRRLVLKHHPDKFQDEEKKAKALKQFQAIQTAYETLGDKDKRARFDLRVKLKETFKDKELIKPFISDFSHRDISVPSVRGGGLDFDSQRLSPYQYSTAELGRQRRHQATIRRDREHRKSVRAKTADQRGQGFSDWKADIPNYSDASDSDDQDYHLPTTRTSDPRKNYSSASRPSTVGDPVPARMPFSTTVFYDLQLYGELNGHTVSTFPDKGACWNFLSLAYAREADLPVNASDRVTVYVADLTPVRSLGSVELPFCFKNDTQEYLLKFHVLPKCISDIILGSTFLRLTDAFTRFSHCIHRTLRHILPHRICFMGGRQQRIGGWIDGHFVAALPDTGSDLMLMSRSYANKRRHVIDDDPEFCITLQLGDLSTTQTTGYVGGLEWQFGDRDHNAYGGTELCGFWIVDELACDVIFSDEFLVRTKALEEMAHCEFELETDEVSLNAIKAIRIRSKKSIAPPSGLEAWNTMVQKETLYQSEVESELRHLSDSERQMTQEKLKQRWEDLMARHPGPP